MLTSSITFFIYLRMFFPIFYCRHKRKVQNFLPCKTPTRGPLDPNSLPGGQSLTYEDPDVHIGHHRPLVIRQHPLNMEVCQRLSTLITAWVLQAIKIAEISSYIH